MNSKFSLIIMAFYMEYDCKKIFKTGGGSTKDLHTHLLSVHKINLTPSYYFSKHTCYTCTINSLYRISFNVICRSSDIRAGLIATGFKSLHATINILSKMVVDYSRKIRSFLIIEIAGKKM